MILSIEGIEGCGKSTLALGAPGPILVVNIDRNLEGVVDPFIQQGKHIDEIRLNIQRENKSTKLVIGNESKLKLTPDDLKASQECIAYHSAEFKRFRELYHFILNDGTYHTIIIDSGTDLAELMKLATFGRVEQVPANLYTLLNADWSEIFNKAKDQSHTNLIITHKMKEEWKDVVDNMGFKSSKPTGKMLTSCWKGMPYAVQARIGLKLEGGEFIGKVIRGVDRPANLMQISGEEFPVPTDDAWGLICWYLTGEDEGWD